MDMEIWVEKSKLRLESFIASKSEAENKRKLQDKPFTMSHELKIMMKVDEN